MQSGQGGTKVAAFRAHKPFVQGSPAFAGVTNLMRWVADPDFMVRNRPPEDWFAVFPDPIVGGAVMDRLVSGAVKLIVTSGRSYRKEGRSWQEAASISA